MPTTAPPAAPARPDGRALAVALGVVRATVPAPAVPPRTLQIAAGRSPLEATGWADVAGAHDAR